MNAHLKRWVNYGETLQREFIANPSSKSKNNLVQYVTASKRVSMPDVIEGAYQSHCFHVFKAFEHMYTITFSEAPTLNLLIGAYLHDIGKLFQPELFFSNHVFSFEERERSKLHTVQGHDFLQMHFDDDTANMALFHHERSDGNGYPTQKRALEPHLELLASIDPLVSIMERRNYHRTQKEPTSEWASILPILFDPYAKHSMDYLYNVFYKDNQAQYNEVRNA